jgi:hypothetical protein
LNSTPSFSAIGTTLSRLILFLTIETQDSSGQPPLHIEALNRNFEIAEYYLENGASPDVTDFGEGTPGLMDVLPCVVKLLNAALERVQVALNLP